MEGVSPIPLSAFVHYQTLFNDVLYPEEIEVLLALDQTYITTSSKILAERAAINGK